LTDFNRLTNNATATGWVLWWTKAYKTCPAANCSSSFPNDRTDPVLSTWAKTTCPGPPTRIRPDTSSGAPTTCASSLGTGPEVVPEAVGCPVRSAPMTWRQPRPTRFYGLPVNSKLWYYTLETSNGWTKYSKKDHPKSQRWAI